MYKFDSLLTCLLVSTLHAIQQMGQAAAGWVVRCGHGCPSIKPRKQRNEVLGSVDEHFPGFFALIILKSGDGRRVPPANGISTLIV